MSDFPSNSKAEAAIDRIARMSGFEEAARTVTFRQPDPVAGRPSPETSFSELMAKMVEQEEAGRKLGGTTSRSRRSRAAASTSTGCFFFGDAGAHGLYLTT